MMKRQRATRGFSLVEVSLALGVAAFCLVAIFGLLPVGINSNQISIEQTAAANMASMVMADLQTIPKGYDTAALSLRFKVPAPPAPGSGIKTHLLYLREDGTAPALPDTPFSAANNPRYRITINYNVPTGPQKYFAVPTQVLITWPAQADPTKSNGSFESQGGLNRN